MIRITDLNELIRDELGSAQFKSKSKLTAHAQSDLLFLLGRLSLLFLVITMQQGASEGDMGSSSDEVPGGATPEYERQRRVRIRENRARMDALGLPGLSASLLGHSPLPSKQQERRERTKKKSAQRTGSLEENDDDYQPSDSDRGREAEGTGESSSDDDEYEEKEKKKRLRKKVLSIQ